MKDKEAYCAYCKHVKMIALPWDNRVFGMCCYPFPIGEINARHITKDGTLNGDGRCELFSLEDDSAFKQ